MSSLPCEFLSLLHRFRPFGVGKIRVLASEKLPQVAVNMLVHNGDMTSRLEALHADEICLDVVDSQITERDGYFREVVLRKATDFLAVEYGVIEIVLGGFSQNLRDEIAQGKVPLGGLLNRDGLGYFSEPQCFFVVDPNQWMRDIFGSSGAPELYGRCNILKRTDGVILARIVEILPSLTQTAN
jgi:chorismate-pyruvate lyase